MINSKKSLHQQRGQGMTEYIIIVALIAIAAIAVYQYFGNTVRNQTAASHRDGMNRPFDALTLGLGVGHGLSGEEPDYTYNGDPTYMGNDPYVIARVWNVREDRTFVAEQAIYNELTNYAGGGGRIPLGDLANTLKKFNAINEHGENSPQKKQLLQDTLNDWIAQGKLNLTDAKGVNVTSIDFGDQGRDKYNESLASDERQEFLGSLAGEESKYPGVCLPGSTVCQPVKF